MNQSTGVNVRVGSQDHHVPQMGRAHRGPVINTRVQKGRTFQFGEGWHSNENTVRFWTPSPRVPKEADTRCYAYTTAYATMTPLCNVGCARSKMPPPSPR